MAITRGKSKVDRRPLDEVDAAVRATVRAIEIDEATTEPEIAPVRTVGERLARVRGEVGGRNA